MLLHRGRCQSVRRGSLPLHRRRVLDAHSWHQSDSLILSEAAATLANVRGAVQRAIEENRVRPDDQMTVTMVHAALQVPRDATLQLAALATRKLQHAFTDLLHGERARAAFTGLTDYQTIAFHIGFCPPEGRRICCRTYRLVPSVSVVNRGEPR